MPTKTLLILFGFMYVIWVLFWSISQPPSPALGEIDQKEQDQANGENKVGDKERDTASVSEEQSSPEPTESYDKASFERRVGEAVIATGKYTAALALLGLFQLVIYFRQSAMLKKSLEATQRAAETADKSADAAAEGASAATKSADAATAQVETMRLEQRGWLTVKPVIEEMAVGKPMQAALFLTNKGRTPCLIYRSRITFINTDGVVDPALILEHHLNTSNWESRENVVASDETFRFLFKATPMVQASYVDGLESGATGIFVVATVEYHDVFEKSRDTRCFYYYDRASKQLYVYEKYNYMH